MEIQESAPIYEIQYFKNDKMRLTTSTPDMLLKVITKLIEDGQNIFKVELVHKWDLVEDPDES